MRNTESTASEHAFNLRSQDEIAFRQAIHLVGVNLNLGFAPCQRDVGVMPLLFGDGADPIHKIQRLLEIRKKKDLMQVVVADHRPSGQLRSQSFKLLSLERRDPAPAGNTDFIG